MIRIIWFCRNFIVTGQFLWEESKKRCTVWKKGVPEYMRERMTAINDGNGYKGFLLQARDLYKMYGAEQSAVKALDGVTMQIRQGELLVILGCSGSRKSTLLNMLGGMDKPDRGTILFQGKDISRINVRGRIACSG